jgi:hypothetical protein
MISIQVKCPHCGKSLMDEGNKVDDKPGIKLHIKASKGEGNIWLSSLYGSFDFQSDVVLMDDEIVLFSCPFCKEAITSKDLCGACSAPVASVNLDMGGKINFCTRRVCTKHSAEFEDLELAMKKLYEELDSYSV